MCVSVPAVHHLLMRWTQVATSLIALTVCASVLPDHFIDISASVCTCRQACRWNFTHRVDGGRVRCGGLVVVRARRQDPCAGGQRWIEVTGATVRSWCCSYGAQGTLQTLALQRKARRRGRGVNDKQWRDRRWVVFPSTDYTPL